MVLLFIPFIESYTQTCDTTSSGWEQGVPGGRQQDPQVCPHGQYYGSRYECTDLFSTLHLKPSPPKPQVASHVLQCEVTWAEQSFLGQALSAFLAEAVINIYLAIWWPAVSIRRFKPQPNTRAGCKNLFAGGKQRGSCKTQPDKHSPQPLELLVKISLIPLPSASSLLGNKASPRILSIRKIEDVLNSTPCRCLMPLTDWTKTTGCNHWRHAEINISSCSPRWQAKSAQENPGLHHRQKIM